MKAKHTPGPWEVYETGPYTSIRTFRATGRHIEVASILRCPMEGYGTANAHLIAAAPDLLSACQDQVKSCPYCQGDMEDDSCASCAGIKAAIKKATGGR